MKMEIAQFFVDEVQPLIAGHTMKIVDTVEVSKGKWTERKVSVLGLTLTPRTDCAGNEATLKLNTTTGNFDLFNSKGIYTNLRPSRDTEIVFVSKYGCLGKGICRALVFPSSEMTEELQQKWIVAAKQYLAVRNKVEPGVYLMGYDGI